MIYNQNIADFNFPITENQIHKLCKKFSIENYSINTDLSVNVNGHVLLHHKKLNQLPLNFNYVSGNFVCSHNYLKILKGSPKQVGVIFIVITMN